MALLVANHFRRRLTGFTISSTPSFSSAEEIAWYRQALQACSHYIEYGSGGSTVLAAQLQKPFTSTESDPAFFKALQSRLRLYENQDVPQLCRLVDIGPVTHCSYPLYPARFLSASKKSSWRSYSDFPELGIDVDASSLLILVDGRFRVACALKAMVALQGVFGWTMAMDDYLGRPHYHAIEEWITPSFFIGRIAVFTWPLSGLDIAAMHAAIAHYELDAR